VIGSCVDHVISLSLRKNLIDLTQFAGNLSSDWIRLIPTLKDIRAQVPRTPAGFLRSQSQ